MVNVEKRITSTYAGGAVASRTWVDRLTDKSNFWLNATRLEDEGNGDDAVVFYLKDAKESLSAGSLVEAALSSSCAASVLASLGNESHAQRLYLEAAKLYEENAEASMKSSVREVLWSLEKAYLNYLLANEHFKSQHIYNKFFSISRKINPFMSETKLSEMNPGKKSVSEKKQTRVNDKVLKEFRDFIGMRSSKAKVRRLQ
jgi:hypothetical protein